MLVNIGTTRTCSSRDTMYKQAAGTTVRNAAILARWDATSTKRAPMTKPAMAFRVFDASMEAIPNNSTNAFQERWKRQPATGNRRLKAITARMAPETPIAFELCTGKTPMSLVGYCSHASLGHKSVPIHVNRSSKAHRVQTQLKRLS